METKRMIGRSRRNRRGIAPVLIVAVVLAAVMGLIGMIMGGMALANGSGGSPGPCPTAGLDAAQDAYGNDLDAARGDLATLDTAYQAAKAAKEKLIGACEDRLAQEQLGSGGRATDASTGSTAATTGAGDPAAELARLQDQEEDSAGAYEGARAGLRQALDAARLSVDAARTSADALDRAESGAAAKVQERAAEATPAPSPSPLPVDPATKADPAVAGGRVEELAARVDELARAFPTEFPPADEIRAGYRLQGGTPTPAPTTIPTPAPTPDPQTVGSKAWVVVAAVDRQQKLAAWEGPFEQDLSAAGEAAAAFEARLVEAEAAVLAKLGDRSDEVDVVRITVHSKEAPPVDRDGVKCGTGGKMERSLRKKAVVEGDETED